MDNNQEPKEAIADLQNAANQNVRASFIPEDVLPASATIKKRTWITTAAIIIGSAIISFIILISSPQINLIDSKITPKNGDEDIDIAMSDDIDMVVNYNGDGSMDSDKNTYDLMSETLASDSSNDYSNLYKNLIEQEGVEWYEHPKINLDSEFGGGFEIGKYRNEPIVFRYMPYELEMFPQANGILFLVHSNKSITVLNKHSSGLSLEVKREHEQGLYFPNETKFDNNFVLSALSPNLSVVNGALQQLSSTKINVPVLLFAQSVTYGSKQNYLFREFIKDTQFGPLYKIYDYNVTESVNKDKSTAFISYAIRLPGGLFYGFDYKLDFIGDDRVPDITWNDGSKNKTRYRTDSLSGCGGGGPEVATEKIDTNDLRYAGKTKSGEAVYDLVNKDHPLIKRVFDSTKGEIYPYNEKTGKMVSSIISVGEFIERHGVLIYIDKNGEQIIMTNAEFGPQAECGKPVVYLYPTAITTVTVSVDALVTKSDPEYNGGWTATAYPNGKLVVNGKEHDYLYWDGYGNGDYPTTDEGFVVPTNNAIETMSSHLRIMGFNNKEIADFVEFWTPHLPKQKYTKFYWIGTSGMEQMAKLSIEPRPDTLLRAFIDYEGVDEYVQLKPQQLRNTKREGFVATEWGGLLRQQ